MAVFVGMLLALAVAWLIVGNTTGEDVADDPIDTTLDALTLLTSGEDERLSQLNPSVIDAFRLLIQSCSDAGVPVFVGQTLRTAAQEKGNIDAGKTAATLKVSWHQLGRACDLYPLDPDTGKPDYAGKHIELFQQMHSLAAAQGFRGIAFNSDGSKRIITNSRGKGIWDGGHLEYRYPYDSIADAIAAEGADYGIVDT